MFAESFALRRGISAIKLHEYSEVLGILSFPLIIVIISEAASSSSVSHRQDTTSL